MELGSLEKIVVVGAGHGIGFALIKHLQTLEPQAEIIATYRDESKAAELLADTDGLTVTQMDPCDEGQVENLRFITDQRPGKLHLLINAVGWLHCGAWQPEKSLKKIDVVQLMESFKVNTMVAAILGKHFLSGFRHGEHATFACLSAKVGSIEDNKIGGWYGYRASKAALNMMLRTMAIEFQRYGCRCDLLAIHPGTTVTGLSEPFIKRTKLKLHDPADSAQNILRVIGNQSFDPEARFLSWDGSILPW